MSSDSMEDTRAIVRQKFVEVRKLLDGHEKSSTEREPYKIKYEAINVLKEIETSLTSFLKNVPNDKRADELIMLAVVHLNMGILHADTEELKAGEEQFTKCIEILKGKELEPEAVLPVLSALNQLGIIWSQWGQPSKAKAFLDEAEQIYKDFTDTSNDCRDPINMATNFGIEEAKDELSPKDVLEKVHTLTLYYLAQVYGSLKDHDKSAVYCHMTLRRQLGDNDIKQDIDFVDWALNAATLSQYFMENNGFPQTRHHLAAASYMLQKYESILKKKAETDGESEALAAEWENVKHRSADVARCWAKYGILLLSVSKQRLLQKTEKDEESDNLESKDNTQSKTTDDLKFAVLEKDIEPIANQITDKYLLDFTDAKPVFLNAQKWLEEAKTYYTLENHASDHILIAQDMSQAYKYLSFFEEHEDRQAKMHKRRVDILESVLKELNPQFYKSACRQIWVELGETYSDILDIKLDRLRVTDEKPNAHALTKINHLAKSAIQNFQFFLDSLETRNTNGMQQFSEDVLQPALFAYFHLGRMYSKIITPDKSIQLENTQNSINAYRFIVDYCDKYAKAAEIMKVELNLCRELVNLLSLKVTRLRQEMMD